MFNPFSNVAQTIQMFNQFRQNYQGNPQEQVQQMLNSGQITQEQLNQVIPIAQQLYGMMGGGNPSNRR